jgi:hypothetical protein
VRSEVEIGICCRTYLGEFANFSRLKSKSKSSGHPHQPFVKESSVPIELFLRSIKRLPPHPFRLWGQIQFVGIEPADFAQLVVDLRLAPMGSAGAAKKLREVSNLPAPTLPAAADEGRLVRMDSRRIRVDIVGSPRPSRRGQSFVRNDLRPPFDSLPTYPSYPHADTPMPIEGLAPSPAPLLRSTFIGSRMKFEMNTRISSSDPHAGSYVAGSRSCLQSFQKFLNRSGAISVYTLIIAQHVALGSRCCASRPACWSLPRC